MRSPLLTAAFFLVAFVLTPPFIGAGCSSSTGCDDCVYSYTCGHNVCAKVEYDASCSCTPITNGCDLGTESCDYTGSGGSCGPGPNGICQEYQSSVAEPLPPEGTDLIHLPDNLAFFDEKWIVNHQKESIALGKSAGESSAAEPAQSVDKESTTRPESP